MMTFCQSTAIADPFQGTMQVCNSFLHGLDTARALSIKVLADSYLPDSPDEFASQVKSLRMQPSDYEPWEVDRFRADYQATVLFSKLPSPVERPALKAAAIEGFIEGEKRLQELNSLWFNESKVEHLLYQLGVDLQELRKIIKQILGRAPSWKTLARKGRWTTGSSFLLSRRKSNEAAKCMFGTSCTYPLAKKINEVLLPEDIPLINWLSRLVLAPGNLVDTVPKNITTDRTIAKEPEINMFFQNAIGLSIRERLYAVGIDLNDQGNNQWACQMAQRLKLATLDLKNASNSICLGLVCCLLPPDWLELILTTRSERGTFDSRKCVSEGTASWFEYQMISSMGNGFTFELESLLFFAICLSAGCEDYNTYVYGDDIIIPQRHVAVVVPVLELCGFSLNTEKSFLEGTFYESCGVYYFNNVDVTPLKIKELLYGPKDCIVLANKIRWFSHLSANLNGCSRRFLPAWQACIRRLPDDIRRLAHGPVGYGQGVWKNRGEVRPIFKTVRNPRKPDFQEETLYEIRETKETRNIYHYGVFIAALSRVRSVNYYEDSYWEFTYRPSGNRIPKESEGFSIGKLYHDGSDWYDLGIWQ